MLRSPRWNSQESFSTPPRISYVRVLKGSRAFYPIPRAASTLVSSPSPFLSFFLSLSSLCIALLANPLDEEYARLPPSSSRPPRKGHPDLEWVHSRVSRKNHISTFLVHQARRVFSASSVRNFLFARSSYFFASPSWKGYRGYRDNLICQN